jgi:hypothetical protein
VKLGGLVAVVIPEGRLDVPRSDELPEQHQTFGSVGVGAVGVQEPDHGFRVIHDRTL